MRAFFNGMAILGLFMGLLAPTQAHGGPKVLVGVEVPVAQRVVVDRLDHSSWDALLKTYVDQRGFVDYTAWKASAADLRKLDDYLKHLSSAKLGPSANRNAVLAFWINAYNAVTVRGILREYPTTSIRNHTAKLWGYNIWKDLQIPVDGQHYSLDAIEHELLRPMGEPRIHFAIVCASIGCPKLAREAYLPAKLDQQLDASTRAFFADPTKFRADVRSRTLAVSPILKWFAEDFGDDAATRIRWMAPYVPQSAAALARGGNARLTYLDYDWGLNDQAKP